MAWLEELREFIDSGVKANHRRMIVITGSDDSKVAKYSSEVVGYFIELTKMTNGIYLYQPEYPDAESRLTTFLNNINSDKKPKPTPFKETKRLLGKTLDYAVLDLFNDLKPNDIGRVGSVVRGGGIYVLMVPPLDRWVKVVTKFQETLITPPHKPDEVRHFLKVRFWRSLMDADGVAVFNVDDESFIRRPEVANTEAYRPRPIKLPDVEGKPINVYKLAKTQDQVNVISLIEREVRGEGKVNVVVIADRGRGKSAAIGLSIALVAHRLRRRRGRARIVVTAESPDNAETLMEFARRGLEAMDYDVEAREYEGYISSIEAKGIFIDYYRPYPLLSLQRRIDLVVVDEAAMMPLPILYSIHRRFDKVIYATTIHGYEGAGRGFSLRFMKYLKERKGVRVVEYEMSEPIRYAENDPIERWLFKTLLLDAEPAKITEEDLKLIEEGRVRYIKPNLEEFFLSNEEGLRQFFGIYVQAHYRNEPDDLGMMMDAPHHTIRALALENGKIVVSVELAEEGGLSDDDIKNMLMGFKPAGNIIPDRMVKYWKKPEFAKLRGWRIVRIATHPELQGRGLGSMMLKFIEEEARESGLDWVGVGFGVNEELLRFWLKNGYMPIHMSPDRNPVSGEFSLLMIKPISDMAREIVDYANKEFRIRMVMSLGGPYKSLEPEIALMLIIGGSPIDEGYTPNITKGQINRLLSYAWGPMTYENTVDALIELFKAYLYRARSNGGLRLMDIIERGLITKVFQQKTWREAADELGVKPTVLMLGLREAARVVLTYLYGDLEVPVYMVQPSKRGIPGIS